MSVSTGNRVKSPAKVFKQCPACDHPELLKFEGQAICMSCDWTSIEVHEEARILAKCRPAFRQTGFGDERESERYLVEEMISA